MKHEYASILQAYLGGEGESASLRAYDFTRRCMRDGLAPDDVMGYHIDVVESSGLDSETAARAQGLLLEVIMAFSLSYRTSMESLESANQELQRLSRFRTRMLSMVAHDLTNHIQAIKLMTVSLLREEDLLPQTRERLTHIMETVEDEERLVSQLLEIARIEAGRLHISLEPVELLPVLQRTIERFRRTSPKHHFHLVAEPAAVRADRGRLQQIVENLVGNAVKYSPNGGRIEVTARPAGGYVAVSITDHGLGVPAEDLPHLFEPFYRSSAHSTIKGTGLGLAIVRSLVELQQGTISVASSPDEGTTFRFALPAASIPRD